jgi:hypothetical protein
MERHYPYDQEGDDDAERIHQMGQFEREEHHPAGGRGPHRCRPGLGPPELGDHRDDGQPEEKRRPYQMDAVDPQTLLPEQGVDRRLG